MAEGPDGRWEVNREPRWAGRDRVGKGAGEGCYRWAGLGRGWACRRADGGCVVCKGARGAGGGWGGGGHI